MSSNKKTIKINPDDFGISSRRKSRKNAGAEKEKKSRASPVFKPNALKKKLIERIKQHKGGSKSTTSQEIQTKGSNISNNMENNSISKNEFKESLNYLSELTSQRNKESPYPTAVHTKPKTAKIYNIPSSDYTPVSIDLPEDLKSYNIQSTNNHNMQPIVINSSQTTNNPHKHTPPPYGCLKGGQKPTYRTWNKTIRSDMPTSRQPIIIEPSAEQISIQPQPLSEREEKLQQLKKKFKEINQKSEIKKPIEPSFEENSSLQFQSEPINILNSVSQPAIDNSLTINTASELIPSKDGEDTNFTPVTLRPKRTKKTTTKKYKLGKQPANRKVGVLIKDRQTRKKILEAQKAIRRKSLVEVKNYLHERGLIKYGSKAPNDVLRKIYESSMLTGEINNQDSDVLAYNMMNSEENF